MNILRKNRTAVGNIALVLFVAFMFSFAFSGTANAAESFNVWVKDKNGNYVQNPTGSQASLAITRGNDLTLDLLIQPVTPGDFNSILFEIVNVGNGTVMSEVYLSDNSIIKSVYESVYENVYKLVYNFTTSGLTDGTYGFELGFYQASEVLKSVYLALEVKPPVTSSPGTVITAPTEDTSSTTETEAGDVVVDETTDSATLTVEEEKVTSTLNETGKITIEIPATVTTTEKVVSLPQAVVSAVKEKSATIEVKLPEVTVNIPAAALAVAEISGASADAKVNLVISAVKEEAVKEIDANIPAANKANLTGVAQVIEFNLSVVEEGKADVKVTKFAQTLTVEIPYQAKAGVDESKLGVYRLADDGTSWTYVGGKVDAANKKVSVNLGSFSKYTVMEYNKVFVDTFGHWSRADVELMAAKHIAKGINDFQFAPNSETTRAEFATLLVRALGIAEEKPAVGKFVDVASSAWYFGAVEAAAKAGLITGYDDSTFKPNANITRQEMAAMIVRAMEYAGQKPAYTEAQINQALAGFGDADQIGNWAKSAAAVAAKEGIVNGRTDANFAPTANATRAEGIVMIKRMLTNFGEL
ncbi:MAG: S-layer homology domain-containing protein [Bacillota bacterium]|nr:S-layer homology domain-containing protein [Bacillota bacterium]